MTLSLLYYSFRELPLGDATTIIFSSPVIVIALSFLFLKEPCGILRIVVVCTLFTGVVLVARPPFLFQVISSFLHFSNSATSLSFFIRRFPRHFETEQQLKDLVARETRRRFLNLHTILRLYQMHRAESYNLMGYLCAILATLFTALNIVVMRKCSDVHYSILVLNLSCWSLAAAVFFYFVVSGNVHGQPFRLPHDWFTWIQILLVAITGLSGQVLVTKALKIEGAGKVSVTRSLDIILAYVIQVYLFKDKPTSTSVSGAILIIFSVVCMGLEKEIYSVCDFIP